MKRLLLPLLLPILSACVFATVVTPAVNAESTIPDTFDKQGITIQIGAPGQGPHGHRYQYIRHPNGLIYRYDRYGYRPNRRIYRRIYHRYPYGDYPSRRIYRRYPVHRPNRRVFRYYRYEH